MTPIRIQVTVDISTGHISCNVMMLLEILFSDYDAQFTQYLSVKDSTMTLELLFIANITLLTDCFLSQIK